MQEKNLARNILIRQFLNRYIKAMQNFDFTAIAACWHKGGREISLPSGTDRVEAIPVENAPEVDQWQMAEIKSHVFESGHIEEIHSSETAAMASVRLERIIEGNKLCTREYLSLIKKGEDWKIAAKISSLADDNSGFLT